MFIIGSIYYYFSVELINVFIYLYTNWHFTDLALVAAMLLMEIWSNSYFIAAIPLFMAYIVNHLSRKKWKASSCIKANVSHRHWKTIQTLFNTCCRSVVQPKSSINILCMTKTLIKKNLKYYHYYFRAQSVKSVQDTKVLISKYDKEKTAVRKNLLSNFILSDLSALNWTEEFLRIKIFNNIFFFSHSSQGLHTSY